MGFYDVMIMVLWVLLDWALSLTLIPPLNVLDTPPSI